MEEEERTYCALLVVCGQVCDSAKDFLESFRSFLRSYEQMGLQCAFDRLR